MTSMNDFNFQQLKNLNRTTRINKTQRFRSRSGTPATRIINSQIFDPNIDYVGIIGNPAQYSTDNFLGIVDQFGNRVVFNTVVDNNGIPRPAVQVLLMAEIQERTRRKNLKAPQGTTWSDVANRYVNITPENNLFSLDVSGTPIISANTARSIHGSQNDAVLGFPRASTTPSFDWKGEGADENDPRTLRNWDGIEDAYRRLDRAWTEPRLIPVHANFAPRYHIPSELGTLTRENNEQYRDISPPEHYWSNGYMFWKSPEAQRALYNNARVIFDREIASRRDDQRRQHLDQISQANARIEATEKLIKKRTKFNDLRFENEINTINRQFRD